MSRRVTERGRASAPRIRRRVGWVALLALLVAIGVYIAATLVVPVSPTKAVLSPYTAPGQSSLALRFPNYGATAVEAEGYTGSLTTSGDSQPRSIASISKIVTALVVLSQKPLNGGNGPTITVTAEESALYATYLAQDGEVAPEPVGLQLTERQVLQVMLIKSANNYAGTLALWAFGSIAAYQAATKTWLAAHDLDHTTIVEPTGLDAANQSTATDLVSLGRMAIADTDVAGIVSTASITIPGVGEVDNSNKLLSIDGVEGIKTGTLDQAGACLLFASKQVIDGTEVTIVGAMLGGTDHTSLDVDVQKLLSSVTAGFHTVQAVTKGTVYGTYATPWGATAHSVATADVKKLVFGRAKVTATIESHRLEDAHKGTRAGTLMVTVGDSKYIVPLELDHALPGPDGWWRVSNPSKVL